MHPLARRICRLDHGKSLQARALEKLTDDELHSHIRNRLSMVDPDLADRYSPDFSVSELHAIFDEASAILKQRSAGGCP
jgi:hypothetical protein